MKKIFISCVTVILVFLLLSIGTACKPQTGEANEATVASETTVANEAAVASDDISIYIIGYAQEGGFNQLINNGSTQAATDFSVNVVYTAPLGSGGTVGMIEQINSAIAAKPDGMGINYMDKSMEAATKAALDAGIQVVLYNNNRFEESAGGATTDPQITSLAYVGQNETTAGSIVVKNLIPLMPNKGKVVILNPFPEAAVLSIRRDSCAKALEANGYTWEELVVPGFDAGGTKGLFSAYYEANKDIVGMIGLGNISTNPAVQFCQEKGLKIPAAAYEIDAEAIKQVQDGYPYVLVTHQGFLESYLTVMNLMLNLRYGFQPVNIDTGTMVVTKDNVDKMVRLVNDKRG